MIVIHAIGRAFELAFFLIDHPVLATIWGPLIGPVVAVASFVCSIGNVPLAAVLWNGGISFGGVVSFIFADLLILPILVIYRKYYGGRMALFLLATPYAASVIAGYIVEVVFGALALIPSEHHAEVRMAHLRWNYTTFLNLAFLVLATALLVRFVRTGGMDMLKMMGGGPDDMGDTPTALTTIKTRRDLNSRATSQCELFSVVSRLTGQLQTAPPAGRAGPAVAGTGIPTGRA
jgi:uncharacterized membrane protein YraQ (UPF0718 family)